MYARYLILNKLDVPGINVDLVIRALRRLPWRDAQEQVETHVLKAALRAARTKYVNIPIVADCLSGLNM
jgi:hypothetical protein